MPASFTIDTQTGCVLTTATGILSYADVVTLIHGKVKAGVMTNDELVDCRNVTLDFSSADLPAIVDEVRGALGNRAPGRTAIITNSAFLSGLARAYADLIKETQPWFKVFTDLEEARQWLAKTEG
jgi:hypothetical protein